MADGGSRHDYPNRSGFNRKRRFREDDDFGHRQQRRRYEEPLSIRVRKQILAVAESAIRRPEDEIEQISRTITEHYDDDYFVRSVVQLIPRIVLEQPLKIPAIAAIILYANTRKCEFAEAIIVAVGESLQTRANDGALREVKLLLRFLACLQPLFEGTGVFVLLEELFNRAVDLQTASSEDTIGLELVHIILFTIPYAMLSTTADLEQKAQELLEKTDIIASTTHILDRLVDPYISAEEIPETASSSALLLLQKQLQSEASTGWPLKFMPRLYKSGSTEVTEPGQKHRFPAIVVPDPINSGNKAYFPKVYFTLFGEQDIETVPPTSSLACSLIRDTLVDTIDLLDFNRNAAAKFLVDLDCYWDPDTFVKRATPFDKLKEPGVQSTWKPEDMAVDAIFSQMLQIPYPELKLVYYHSLVTETCKIAPAAIAPSLGRAIRFLYRKLDALDVELAYRFLDWFSHHLSNFDFRWKWTEWAEDVQLSNLHARKAFVLGTLDKEVRLSFAKRIRTTLPAEYQPLIPSTKDNDIPNFKYSSDTTPFSQQGRDILSLLKKKAPESDLQPVFDSIHEAAIEHNIAEPMIPSTDAYVTAICHIGSKSLSHVLSFIERCKDRLLAIGSHSRATQIQIVKSVVGYWREQNPGVAVSIVDKLLNYTILTPMSVMEWAMTENLEGGKSLSETWVYEMVSSTMYKVTNRVQQIAAARNQRSILPEQVTLLEETLVKERAEMKKLFEILENALIGVAEGATDQILEQGDGILDGGLDLVKGWGAKWLRVFRRKLAVEDAVLSEMLKVQPEAVTQMEVEANGNGNGIAAGEENHGLDARLEE